MVGKFRPENIHTDDNDSSSNTMRSGREPVEFCALLVLSSMPNPQTIKLFQHDYFREESVPHKANALPNNFQARETLIAELTVQATEMETCGF